jgi:hypothetical protein
MRFFNTFWGSLVMLIALMLVLEHSVCASKLLAAGTNFTSQTVGAFKGGTT